MRIRRRRRDLLLGMAAGLMLTSMVSGYFLFIRRDGAGPPPEAAGPTYDVRLTVNPPWATVMVDGKPAPAPDGDGRLSLSLPADGGSFRWVEVSAPGYHTLRRPLSFFEGTNEFTIELVQKPFDVAIRTTPPDCEVWINEKLKGYSPLTVTVLPGEKNTLTVKHPGYAPLAQQILPPRGSDRVELELSLKAKGPVIQVEADPPGSLVLVDGTVRGFAPLSVELDADHFGRRVEVRAQHKGCEDATTTVSLPQTPGDEPVKAMLVLRRPAVDGGIAPVVSAAPPRRRPATADPGISSGATPRPPGQAGIVVERPGFESVRRANEPARPADPSRKPAGERVVFVLVSPVGGRADHLILLKQIEQRIAALRAEQRFAVIACIEEGVEAWPEASDTQAATPEQKVRAYDFLRARRPAGRGVVIEGLRAALELRPAALWLFATDELRTQELSSLDAAMARQKVELNVVATGLVDRTGRLAKWCSRHGGRFTVLDAPPVALDPSED